MKWEYIAGFFDGEGCISHNGKGYRIAISQTNQEVLDGIVKFSKVGYVCKITKRKSHWKDSWIYYISKQDDVLYFLKRIFDYLIVKNAIAKKVIPELSKYAKKRNVKISVMEHKKAKALEMRTSGASYREIGKQLNLDWGYVRRILIKMNVR
ncbi:MAG: LAGLIDADG family homing endonuclease [Candidatus Paceibacterota bacterium]